MNIDTLSIEELAELRDKVNSTLADRIATRQKELQTELERVGALVSKAPTKRAVKYRDGTNEWSGTGSMPAWLKAKGDNIEYYRV